MIRRELFIKALDGCARFHEKFPNEKTIVSIIKQLQYLIELEDGICEDRKKLNDIIIGVLVVREIEVLDTSLAELLYQVDEVVDGMKNEKPKK